MHIRYVESVSETSKVHPIDMSELVLHMAQSRLVQAEETMAKTRAEVAEVGPENRAQNPCGIYAVLQQLSIPHQPQ
jgi:hypothetical protein